MRLVREFQGFSPGLEGYVVGRYAREYESYVVKFDADGVEDVPPDALELVAESSESR